MRLAEVFGRNVRRLRRERGMSLEALAQEVGLAYSYMGQIERAQRNPTLEIMERIAHVVGAEVLDLLKRQE